jgi:hypothetical protein
MGVIIIFVIFCAIAIRIIAGGIDAGRIERYLSERDCKLIEKSTAIISFLHRQPTPA